VFYLEIREEEMEKELSIMKMYDHNFCSYIRKLDLPNLKFNKRGHVQIELFKRGAKLICGS
jgi:hypothetical protein